MIVTIKILTCADGHAAVMGTALRDLVVARGYLPSGQEFITSKIVPRTERASAIRTIVEWIFRHRPAWSIEIDDQRFGHTEVTS